METAIGITAKLLDARDTMRRLNTPEQYANKIAEYQGYIRQGMIKWEVEELEATMRLLKKCADSPFTVLGFMAAFVEMNSNGNNP